MGLRPVSFLAVAAARQQAEPLGGAFRPGDGGAAAGFRSSGRVANEGSGETDGRIGVISDLLNFRRPLVDRNIRTPECRCNQGFTYRFRLAPNVSPPVNAAPVDDGARDGAQASPRKARGEARPRQRRRLRAPHGARIPSKGGRPSSAKVPVCAGKFCRCRAKRSLLRETQFSRFPGQERRRAIVSSDIPVWPSPWPRLIGAASIASHGRGMGGGELSWPKSNSVLYLFCNVTARFIAASHTLTGAPRRPFQEEVGDV